MDKLLVPMQCTGNSCCFSWRKRAAEGLGYPACFPCVKCFRVSIPPAVIPIYIKSCKTDTRMGIRYKQSKIAQELTRRDTLPPCPARGSNPGSICVWGRVGMCVLWYFPETASGPLTTKQGHVNCHPGCLVALPSH